MLLDIDFSRIYVSISSCQSHPHLSFRLLEHAIKLSAPLHLLHITTGEEKVTLVDPNSMCEGAYRTRRDR